MRFDHACRTTGSPRAETPSELAVIRRRAAGHHPIGSLLVNPGGPGEPGVEFLSNFFSYGELPPEILKNFDIVSWDPRGTGASDGIACLTTADFLEAEPLPYPPTKAERAKVAAKDAAQTKQCLATEGDTMPVVGTRETVHDLDALKTALGDEKLTYLGFSYGTAIGLEYLKAFPTHVRAMVLDGIDLPGTDPTSTAYAQVASFEQNLDAFLADCKADRSCEFGDGDPRGALTAFLDRARDRQAHPGELRATGRQRRLPQPDRDPRLHRGARGHHRHALQPGLLAGACGARSWRRRQSPPTASSCSASGTNSPGDSSTGPGTTPRKPTSPSRAPTRRHVPPASSVTRSSSRSGARSCRSSARSAPSANPAATRSPRRSIR